MMEGSGSVPLTNGSGSERYTNLQILRIRIPNTDLSSLITVEINYMFFNYLLYNGAEKLKEKNYML
jgi:hypothetical protein